jgi:hypothetical protein
MANEVGLSAAERRRRRQARRESKGSEQSFSFGPGELRGDLPKDFTVANASGITRDQLKDRINRRDITSEPIGLENEPVGTAFTPVQAPQPKAATGAAGGAAAAASTASLALSPTVLGAGIAAGTTLLTGKLEAKEQRRRDKINALQEGLKQQSTGFGNMASGVQSGLNTTLIGLSRALG